MGAMMGVATGISVAGSAISTYGQVQGARAQAKLIRQDAQMDEDASRRNSLRIMAQRRAMGAASGLDTSSGSPLLMQLDQARQAELEALKIRYRGETQSKLIKAQIPGMYAQGISNATGSVMGGYMKGR